MKPALHLILQIYIDHEANQPLFSGHRHHIEQKKGSSFIKFYPNANVTDKKMAG